MCIRLYRHLNQHNRYIRTTQVFDNVFTRNHGMTCHTHQSMSYYSQTCTNDHSRVAATCGQRSLQIPPCGKMLIKRTRVATTCRPRTATSLIIARLVLCTANRDQSNTLTSDPQASRFSKIVTRNVLCTSRKTVISW